MDKTAPGPAKSVAESGVPDSPDAKGGEFRMRVYDHDDHVFEPSPVVPVKPKPFNPSKHRYLPIAVPVIMIGSIVIFILMMNTNDCPAHIAPGRKCVAPWLKPLSFEPWDENPMLGPRAAALLRWGALESTRVTHHGQGWRLVSAIALNGGVFHLIFNVLVLLVVGTRLEFTFWFPKIAILYLISGYGGNVLSALLIQNHVFAGAGGAICGLIGGGLADVLINWQVTSRKLFKLVDLILFLLISLGFGLMPQVGNFANVGGFVTGFLLGLVLLKRPQQGFKDVRHLSQLEAFIVNSQDPDLPPLPMHKVSHRVVSWIAFFLVLGLLTAGTVILLLHKINLNKHCHWCHYGACVPNLKWECPGPYSSSP